jgi:hypothetical protein
VGARAVGQLLARSGDHLFEQLFRFVEFLLMELPKRLFVVFVLLLDFRIHQVNWRFARRRFLLKSLLFQ